jgi:uncharacterized membrane protein
MCTIGLLLGTELLFIKDSFGSRMNTVFKFYYHIWLLLGLLSPLLIAYLLRGPVPLPTSDAAASPVAGDAPTPTAARPRAARSGGLLAFALGATAVVFAGALTLAGLLYPLGATATKTGSFRGPATLDGAAWMETSRPGDAQAVRWLRERVPGRPVIAEAFGDDYTEAARVSTFAGLPTLLGWIGHELQWRGPQNEFDRRKQTVEAIYRTADPATLLVVLQGLKLEYVYVGRMEVEKYGPAVRDRFEGRMDVVYRGGDVTIYRLPQTTGIGVGLAEVRP